MDYDTQLKDAKRRLARASEESRAGIEREIRTLRQLVMEHDPIVPVMQETPPERRRISGAEFNSLALEHGEAWASGYNANCNGYGMIPPSNLRKKADRIAFEDGWLAFNVEPRT